MKAITKLLIAGMLAMAIALPAVQARSHVQTVAQVDITDALAYRILEAASGELEALMGVSLTMNGLLADYHLGMIIIKSLGSQDGLEWFRVIHTDAGGEVLAALDDF